jgi:integrase
VKVAATLAGLGGRLVISEPKTDRSRREVPLHPGIVTVLRKHRTAQKEERMASANIWADTNLVFTTETGAAVDPRNLLRVIETAAKTAKVHGVGIHTLRHSAAVALLESGTHIKAVGDLLGHSSIAITGDIYGHTSDTAARTAINTLGGTLGL